MIVCIDSLLLIAYPSTGNNFTFPRKFSKSVPDSPSDFGSMISRLSGRLWWMPWACDLQNNWNFENITKNQSFG